MAVNRYDSTRAWYAISTYSGYEDKVADSINQRTSTVEMADKIFEAIVPKEKQIEIKNGKRKIVDRKILQGYVLVEIAKIKKRMGVEDPKFSVKYEIGEVVSITDGPFKGFDGAISEIDAAKGKLKVMVSMFGRETPVELDALQVKQIN